LEARKSKTISQLHILLGRKQKKSSVLFQVKQFELQQGSFGQLRASEKDTGTLWTVEGSIYKTEKPSKI
jgi:hypothetical protein